MGTTLSMNIFHLKQTTQETLLIINNLTYSTPNGSIIEKLTIDKNYFQTLKMYKLCINVHQVNV